jgi:hypothetical protein
LAEELKSWGHGTEDFFIEEASDGSGGKGAESCHHPLKGAALSLLEEVGAVGRLDFDQVGNAAQSLPFCIGAAEISARGFFGYAGCRIFAYWSSFPMRRTFGLLMMSLRGNSEGLVDIAEAQNWMKVWLLKYGGEITSSVSWNLGVWVFIWQ